MKIITIQKESHPLPRIALFLIFFLLIPSVGKSASPEQQFENGLALCKKKDYSQALRTFQKLEEEVPLKSIRGIVLFMQAHCLRSLEKWPEAAQAFSRAAAAHPGLSDYALYYQGEVLQMSGEAGKSLEVFKRLATLQPQSLLIPQTELKIAGIYSQLGEPLRSAEVLENLLRKSPRKNFPASALNFLGQARESLGQWGEAIKAYRDLWLKYPLHPMAKRAKARWEQLAKDKKLSLESIPPEALFRRALLLYQAHLDEAALSEMGQIGGFPPQAYPAIYSGERWVDELYFHRGMSHFRLKQYSKASEAFHLVVQNSRNEEIAGQSLYWLIRAFFRLGRIEEAMSKFPFFEKSYPRSPFMDRALYLKAQIAEEGGDIPRAVSLYQEMAEKCPQSSLRFQAMWQSGWLLYQNKDTPAALQAWDRLRGLNPHSRWMAKALYWKGRVLEKLGRAAEAEESYQQLIQSDPTSYYGQLAAARGGSFPAGRKILRPLEDLPLLELKAKPEPRFVHLDKGRILVRLGLFSAALDELEAAEEEARTFEEVRLEVARLYREAGEYHRSALVVRKNFALKPITGPPSESERALYLLAYPLGNASWINYYAQDKKLDPALVSAVILEESRFNSQAISSAGARGWMQIMPRTGTQIAKRMKLRPYSEGMLFDPEMNLRLGSWYLNSLLEEFGGKETLALAAYNAGPHMVRQWLAKTPEVKEDEFVESIPYSETRNYVIRVISSAQVYRTLYSASKSQGKP